MKKVIQNLREAGIFGVMGFLAGTLLPIAIWKTDAGNAFILNGGGWLPFLLSPAFALLATAFMAGYVNFKEKFSYYDDETGELTYSLFWGVLVIMIILGLGVSLEAVIEA